MSAGCRIAGGGHQGFSELHAEAMEGAGQGGRAAPVHAQNEDRNIAHLVLTPWPAGSEPQKS